MRIDTESDSFTGLILFEPKRMHGLSLYVDESICIDVIHKLPSTVHLSERQTSDTKAAVGRGPAC